MPILLTSFALASLPKRAEEATPSAHLVDLSGTVTAAGSGTLGPAVEGAGEAFATEAPGVAVEVEISSSGKGFERFCADEVDIANSGRLIKDEEAAACAASDVAYDVYEVAYDGIAVVVNPALTFVECLTVDQLKRLWEPGSTVSTWADLDPEWPADPIALHGRGADSGTYQYFTQVTVGEEGVSRDDYTVHDSHGAVAEAVAAETNTLGFLPYPHYVAHQDRVRLVEVDGGEGCVAPNPATILDGSYAPLSRPMLLYVKRASLARSEVAAFLRFYLADAAAFAEAGGLVADPAAEDALVAKLEAAIAGTSAPDGPPATPAP
jgi:phosphate transport system substrate-binding protein